MKQVCLSCERMSPDRNLFCQETYCPAEMAPTILDYGEWLGDIEVVKPVMVLRGSVLYEATHQRRKVYLKVAHPGPDNKARLKREAEFLRALQLNKELPPTLPILVAPYANTTIAQDAYGKTMLQGHLLYFCLFEHFEGEPLRDVLVKNPQLWINHVGWMMISLATTVNSLHLRSQYHFALCPDCILVRFNENPSVPHILLFDLGVVSDKPNLQESWYSGCVAPAYTAPELLNGNGYRAIPDYRTDVYGLGLILYETLVGEPTFTYKLRSDVEVSDAVRRGQRVKMHRIEDVERVAQLAVQATSADITQRPHFVADMAEQLASLFGEAPKEKKRHWPSLNTILVVIAALLTIAFLIAVTLSLTGPR
jgi:serine/threonine protein kinase